MAVNKPEAITCKMSFPSLISAAIILHLLAFDNPDLSRADELRSSFVPVSLVTDADEQFVLFSTSLHRLSHSLDTALSISKL